MKTHELENLTIHEFDLKDQLKQHVYERSLHAFAAGDRVRDQLDSSRLQERVKFMRSSFIERIGGLPSSDTPLRPRVTGEVHREGYRIENVIFESRPQTYVTGNMYIPYDAATPRGAVLFVCGHFSDGRLASEYQRVCQYLVQAGLVVLTVDPIGQGERWSYYEPKLQEAIIHPGTAEHEWAGSQCWPLGDALVRYFLHDIMRAIDYLSMRPEVDPDKIGITGNSGGGLQSGMAMLCDPRITAAAPATYLMSRQSFIVSGEAQDAEQIWPGMSAIGFDHEDVLLAMAPKPVLVLAARYDFFPIEGTRRTVQRARRFWEELGKPDNLACFEDDCEHQYSVQMAKAAAVFFAKHLLGKDVNVENAVFAPLEASALWSTASGQVRGDFPSARGVHEDNISRLQAIETAHQSVEGLVRREEAAAWLEHKILANRYGCPLNPRFHKVGRSGELEVRRCLWWSQEKLFNFAFLFRDYRTECAIEPITIALWKGGTSNLQDHMTWLRKTCSAGRTVMVLDVSGEGKLRPTSVNPRHPADFFGTYHKLSTDLIWLDDSLAAMRSYDVVRAVELAGSINGSNREDIQIYAVGAFALYALIAKLLDRDKRIRKLTLKENVGSIGEWVRSRYYEPYHIMDSIIPGMLQVADLPDLVRWTYAGFSSISVAKDNESL